MKIRLLDVSTLKVWIIFFLQAIISKKIRNVDQKGKTLEIEKGVEEDIRKLALAGFPAEIIESF